MNAEFMVMHAKNYVTILQLQLKHAMNETMIVSGCTVRMRREQKQQGIAKIRTIGVLSVIQLRMVISVIRV
jgi:hypothetical protein